MHVDAIYTIVVLSALAFIVYGPWQWACSDYARQVLFEKRDAIFDIARGGRISFESKEYKEIRRSIEILIRFAHQFSVPYFLFVLAFAPKMQNESDLTRNVGLVTDVNTKKEIEKLVRDCHLAIVAMAFAKSPLSLVLLIVLSPAVITASVVLAIRQGKAPLRARAIKIAGAAGERAQIDAEKSAAAV